MKALSPNRIMLVLLIELLMLPRLNAQTSNWKIDEGYSISFSGSGAEGNFPGLTGTIKFDQGNLEQSSFDVSVAAKTIQTGNNTKNKHARGKSWFHVSKFPTIDFRSTAIRKVGSTYEVIGQLEMHGKTKEVVIPFTFNSTDNTGLFEGKFEVDRTEFGILGPFFGFVVGDQFQVSIKVPVVKG